MYESVRREIKRMYTWLRLKVQNANKKRAMIIMEEKKKSMKLDIDKRNEKKER